MRVARSVITCGAGGRNAGGLLRLPPRSAFTWTMNPSRSVPAVPVTFQQPSPGKAIMVAQKCGAWVKPGAIVAWGGLASRSSLLPVIRNRCPADCPPHHGNLVAMEPSGFRSPNVVPGGGGRVVVTTSLPSTGSSVHSCPLPKSDGLSVSPGGAWPFGMVTGQWNVTEALGRKVASPDGCPRSAQPAPTSTSRHPISAGIVRGSIAFNDDYGPRGLRHVLPAPAHVWAGGGSPGRVAARRIGRGAPRRTDHAGHPSDRRLMAFRSSSTTLLAARPQRPPSADPVTFVLENVTICAAPDASEKSGFADVSRAPVFS